MYILTDTEDINHPQNIEQDLFLKFAENIYV